MLSSIAKNYIYCLTLEGRKLRIVSETKGLTLTPLLHLHKVEDVSPKNH